MHVVPPLCASEREPRAPQEDDPRKVYTLGRRRCVCLMRTFIISGRHSLTHCVLSLNISERELKAKRACFGTRVCEMWVSWGPQLGCLCLGSGVCDADMPSTSCEPCSQSHYSPHGGGINERKMHTPHAFLFIHSIAISLH
jgi:hypothetical protein